MAVCSVFSQTKAENLPFTDLASEITPGELLIRLTPEAAADLERLHANAPITTLHAQHNVESLHPLFPYLDASFAQSKPETYLSVAFLPLMFPLKHAKPRMNRVLSWRLLRIITSVRR